MNRCDATAPTGRRCCRPVHSASVKHAIASKWPDATELERIAGFWGYPPGVARSAVRGALSRGPIDSEKFVRLVQAMAEALLSVPDGRHR